MHVAMVGARREAIEALLDGGHAITVLYENTARNRERIAPYRDRLRHECVVDSYPKVESLWSAIHHTGADAEGIDAVLPLFENSVVAAAVLASLLGATAIDPACALRCRDKALQKRAWTAAGVPTAKHVVLTGAPESPAALIDRAGMRAPFVVKPIAGFGAMHTFVVEDRASLDQSVAAVTQQRPEQARLLIEQRNPGGEWIIDGLVLDGEIKWILLSRFQEPMIECGVHKPVRIIALPPTQFPAWYASATEFTQRAVTALGLRDSTFHFEVFGTPDWFVAGELAARPGGGPQPILIHRMLGVDIWECAVKALTREPLPVTATPSEKALGFIGLPINPGKTNHVTSADLAVVPGVVDVTMHFAAGETMPAGHVHWEAQVAGVVVEGADSQECHEVLARALDIVHEINGT